MDISRPSTAVTALVCLALVCAYRFQEALTAAGIPISRMIAIFSGITLQSLPFLAISSLIAAAIEVFLSPHQLARIFPRGRVAGCLVAFVYSALLPVCDCSTVPLVRTLLRRGVPPRTVFIILFAAPSINPLVLFSTWYAFGPSLKAVSLRVAAAIICTALIATLLSIRMPSLKTVLRQSESDDSCECSHGCGVHAAHATRGRFSSFSSASASAFLRVVPYMLIGAALSSFIQGLLPAGFMTGHTSSYVSIAVAMLMAFILSQCSSSDAIVARSMTSLLPPGALMTFMLMGPMLDVKNVFMLSAVFSTRFTLRICATITAVVALAGFVLTWWGLGGAL